MNRTDPAPMPKARTLTPAGPDAVTLTLEDGRAVTVTAGPGTALSPDGYLLTDYKSSSSATYRLPPDLAWEVCARLGLYPEQDRAQYSQVDRGLLELPDVTEAKSTPDGLTLAFTFPDGRPGLHTFPPGVRAEICFHEPGEPMTRFPITLRILEGHGEDLKLYVFKVRHTAAGYAALTVLGWGHRLPAPDGEE